MQQHARRKAGRQALEGIVRCIHACGGDGADGAGGAAAGRWGRWGRWCGWCGSRHYHHAHVAQWPAPGHPSCRCCCSCRSVLAAARLLVTAAWPATRYAAPSSWAQPGEYIASTAMACWADSSPCKCVGDGAILGRRCCGCVCAISSNHAWKDVCQVLLLQPLPKWAWAAVLQPMCYVPCVIMCHHVSSCVIMCHGGSSWRTNRSFP